MDTAQPTPWWVALLFFDMFDNKLTALPVNAGDTLSPLQIIRAMARRLFGSLADGRSHRLGKL